MPSAILRRTVAAAILIVTGLLPAVSAGEAVSLTAKDLTQMGGKWEREGGELRQSDPHGRAFAVLRRKPFSSTRLGFRFRVEPSGSGVRAAGAIIRSTNSETYYGVHFDCRNNQVVLYASPWEVISRKPVVLEEDRWYAATVEARGERLTVALDGQPVMEATDSRHPAGVVGLYTSQGSVTFRDVQVEGEAAKLERPWKDVTPRPHYKIVASGEAAGGYAAFPDLCRARSGDLLCVYYSGYGHISTPNDAWPAGGRVQLVRSRDNGKTWSRPETIADTPHDDRDPHIALLSDGTLICNWFVAWNPKAPPAGERHRYGMFLSRSRDQGRTWSAPERLAVEAPTWFVCSAPIRELPDGSLILGLYTEADEKNAYGATVRSTNGGRTWKDLATIGKDAGLYLDAETDVLRLKDGTLLAALRSSRTDLYFSHSTDGGKSWGPVRSAGFKGRCPIFLRTRKGTILLGQRLPNTALHWSTDEGQTWRGPLEIDSVIGAYPGLAELPDGSVYCVYYEEGAGSSIRGVRLRLDKKGVPSLERRR